MDGKEYVIRVPLDMVQLTGRDGRALPISFDWRDENGETTRVEIDRVLSCVPCAEQKSGAVGDRYECVINGRTEYLYYAIVAPRKWFKLVPVTREEYAAYYRLPGEGGAKAEIKKAKGF